LLRRGAELQHLTVGTLRLPTLREDTVAE